MNKKYIIIIALIVSVLAAFFFFVRYKAKKSILAQEWGMRIGDSIRKEDKILEIKIQREREVYDSLLKNSPRFSDSVYAVYKVEHDKLPKEFPRAMLEGSNYHPGTDGSAYEEKETNGGLKFKINYLTGDDFNEMHCEIQNQFLGASVHRLQDWFFQLEMDLAGLNSYSYNPPVDFKEILKAAVTAQKSYSGDSWRAEDVIKPFAFKGGELHLEKIESNGRSTTLKFTIYLQKINSTHEKNKINYCVIIANHICRSTKTKRRN